MRTFFSHEDDFRFRDKFANLFGHVDSIHTWKSDVQQNQIRLEFFGLPDRFKSIARKVNNAQLWILLELLNNITPPSGKIVYNENADKRLIADSFLLYNSGPIDTNGW